MTRPTPVPTASHLLLGYTAWVLTVVIGSAWQLATRVGVTTSLAPLDLALIRYAVPATVLLPVLFRRGFLPKTGSALSVFCVIVGAGAPFGLLGMVGAQYAPASHMGALVPGSIPVFTALLGVLFVGERLGRAQAMGLLSVVLGVGLIVGASFATATPSVLIGDGLFLLAGVFWAGYTLAFRSSGLTAWHGAAVICFWSTVFVVPLWLVHGQSTLTEAPVVDIVVQVVAQGLLAGLIGLAAYGTAVRVLGAGTAAVSGAAVPALTAVGGWLVLNEALSAFIIFGISLITLGIAVCLRAGARRLQSAK
ncbi:MAG: DMT family transporter [Pseudomonadota bacterium]